MKANKLMIDDWVLYNEIPQKVLEISGIDDEVYLETDELVHQSEIQPIPITPEILKNNGFDDGEYKNYCGLVFYLHVKGFREIGLTMGYKDNILWCERINQNYPNSIGDKYAIHHLDYVHELQHALRLCRIEKEIIL